MENSILHNRLQGQFGNQAGICLSVLRRGQNLKREFIIKPIALNQKVVFDIIEFLAECHNILLLADTIAEKGCQCLGHSGNTVTVIEKCLTPDALQRIIQKMGVDLTLERGKLSLLVHHADRIFILKFFLQLRQLAFPFSFHLFYPVF